MRFNPQKQNTHNSLTLINLNEDSLRKNLQNTKNHISHFHVTKVNEMNLLKNQLHSYQNDISHQGI